MPVCGRGSAHACQLLELLSLLRTMQGLLPHFMEFPSTPHGYCHCPLRPSSL